MNEYQANALTTSGSEQAEPTFRRMIFALGVAGEAGEVADLVKKEVGHGHDEDPERMLKELGDVLWYVAMLADAYHLSLEQVARANARKLAARYPGGFSEEASRNRVA